MAKQLEYAFRLVHIKNIPHNLGVGFVLPTSLKASDNYIQIGDSIVIAKRNTLPNQDIDCAFTDGHAFSAITKFFQRRFG